MCEEQLADSRAFPRFHSKLLVLWTPLCPPYLRQHRIFPSSSVPGPVGSEDFISSPLALASWPSARDPDGRDDRGRQPLPSPLTSPPLPTSRCLLFLSESKNRSWCEPAPSRAQRLKIKRKCGEAAETVTGLGMCPGSNRTLRALPGGQEPRGGDAAWRVHWHTSHVTRHTSHEEGCGEALTRWGRQKQAGRI